jgi:hypothetical protein
VVAVLLLTACGGGGSTKASPRASSAASAPNESASELDEEEARASAYRSAVPLPNPCTLLPDAQLSAALGPGAAVEGPYSNRGRRVTGPFPYDGSADLTCIWNQDASAGSIIVRPLNGDTLATFCQDGIGGTVEGRVCHGSDTSATSAAGAVVLGEVLVHVLASGRAADNVVHTLLGDLAP